MRDIDVRQVIELAEAVAAELSAVALDRKADLTAAERRALMVLSIGIEDAAARATEVPPRSAFASNLLLRSMLATLPAGNDNAAAE